MLRAPQHERNFLNHFKSLSVRPFGKLRAGYELVEGLRVFHQTAGFPIEAFGNDRLQATGN
jgi:hypothetical protein